MTLREHVLACLKGLLCHKRPIRACHKVPFWLHAVEQQQGKPCKDAHSGRNDTRVLFRSNELGVPAVFTHRRMSDDELGAALRRQSAEPPHAPANAGQEGVPMERCVSEARGSGRAEKIPCLNCDGRGWVEERWMDGTRAPRKCRGCGGSGEQVIRP